MSLPPLAAIARLTDTEPPRPTICAWCPDFVPMPGAQSHGICADCRAALDAEQDDAAGSRCSSACGHCGRCS